MNIAFRNTGQAYGLVAQFLHWSVVAGISLQFFWAWRIDESESIRQQFALVNQHKSIGMTVLALVALRLAWRAFNRPPAYPGHMSRWQRRAASATHWLLYGVIVLMPLSGWAYSSAAGYGAEFFGLVEIPGFVPDSEALEELFEELHEALAEALIVLVAVHVLAALLHQFVFKDGLIRRMLPLWKK
ncbi:MAG: cytochrome b [Xanthomonadaceae bacterium]|nr:cytochrome b [Xanthomonadaceae bacterium]